MHCSSGIYGALFAWRFPEPNKLWAMAKAPFYSDAILPVLLRVFTGAPIDWYIIAIPLIFAYTFVGYIGHTKRHLYIRQTCNKAGGLFMKGSVDSPSTEAIIVAVNKLQSDAVLTVFEKKQSLSQGRFLHRCDVQTSYKERRIDLLLMLIEDTFSSDVTSKTTALSSHCWPKAFQRVIWSTATGGESSSLVWHPERRLQLNEVPPFLYVRSLALRPLGVEQFQAACRCRWCDFHPRLRSFFFGEHWH